LAAELRFHVRTRLLSIGSFPASPIARDAIADRDKTALITGAIAAGGSEYGMQTFDQSILTLVQDGHVSVDEALRWVTNVDEFTMRLRGITPGSRG
jgi:twitching motility protein PilT